MAARHFPRFRPSGYQVMSIGELGSPASVSDLAEAKRDARRSAEQRRAAAHAESGRSAATALAARGLAFLETQPFGAVSGFTSFRTEIDVIPLLARLAGDGWGTALPVVTADRAPLIFRRWVPGEPTVAGRFGIPVPHEAAGEILPDVLLVPMLAFDRAGFRLGYGGGFYDLTVERLRQLKPVVAIGIAYAAQEVAAVPRGRYDQPLDWIMTELGVFQPTSEHPIHQAS
jgi:5-formyltetrahydrofolate cyclo-ligase